MRIRRPTLPVALLCLTLGAVSTIGVAWACAAFVNPARCTATFDVAPAENDRTSVVVYQRGFGHTRMNTARCSRLNLDANGNLLMAAWTPEGNPTSRTFAGWPLRAFTCENSDDVSLLLGNSGMRVTGMGSTGGKPIRHGWELTPFTGGMFGTTWRALPLQPMWSGLVIDVLAHAVLWWLAMFGPLWWVRSRRLAAGRCESCGYDLRSGQIAHERCPECGTTVPDEAILSPSSQSRSADPRR